MAYKELVGETPGLRTVRLAYQQGEISYEEYLQRVRQLKGSLYKSFPIQQKKPEPEPPPQPKPKIVDIKKAIEGGRKTEAALQRQPIQGTRSDIFPAAAAEYYTRPTTISKPMSQAEIQKKIEKGQAERYGILKGTEPTKTIIPGYEIRQTYGISSSIEKGLEAPMLWTSKKAESYLGLRIGKQAQWFYTSAAAGLSVPAEFGEFVVRGVTQPRQTAEGFISGFTRSEEDFIRSMGRLAGGSLVFGLARPKIPLPGKKTTTTTYPKEYYKATYGKQYVIMEDLTKTGKDIYAAGRVKTDYVVGKPFVKSGLNIFGKETGGYFRPLKTAVTDIDLILKGEKGGKYRGAIATSTELPGMDKFVGSTRYKGKPAAIYIPKAQTSMGEVLIGKAGKTTTVKGLQFGKGNDVFSLSEIYRQQKFPQRMGELGKFAEISPGGRYQPKFYVFARKGGLLRSLEAQAGKYRFTRSVGEYNVLIEPFKFPRLYGARTKVGGLLEDFQRLGRAPSKKAKPSQTMQLPALEKTVADIFGRAATMELPKIMKPQKPVKTTAKAPSSTAGAIGGGFSLPKFDSSYQSLVEAPEYGFYPRSMKDVAIPKEGVEQLYGKGISQGIFSGQLASQLTGQRPRDKDIIGLGSALTFGQVRGQGQSLLTGALTLPRIDTKQVQGLFPTFARRQSRGTASRQRSLFRFASLLAPLPVIPPAGLEPKKEEKRKADDWDVWFKRFGKWSKIATGLPRGRALKLGTTKAERTLGASFKLTPSAISRGLSDIKFQPSKTVFRSYRIVKGRRVPLKDTYIQKRGFRLSSPSEVSEIMGFKVRSGNGKKRRKRSIFDL